MRRAVNLNWLKSFEASARLLSFTKAAQELELTQAGVSQHIRLLEIQLGEPLFVRSPRAVRLTDAGEAYLQVVGESFERLAAGTSEIFGSESVGVVRLRADADFIAFWLVPRLKDFLDAYPDISLHLSPTIPGEGTDWDDIDMEVRYDCERAAGGTDALALMGDEMFPVCSPHLCRSLRAPIDLPSHRLLHVTGNRRGWTEWLEEAGLATTANCPMVRTESGATAMILAEHGSGVALGHSSLITSMLEQGRLVQPFSSALNLVGIFYLVTPSEHPLRRRSRLFREWLLAEGSRGAANTPQP